MAIVVDLSTLEQIESFSIPPYGFVGRQLRECPVTGTLGVQNRFGRIFGSRRVSPVVSELTDSLSGIIAAEFLERLGDDSVRMRCSAGA